MADIKKPRTGRLSWDETFMSLAMLVAQRTACRYHLAGVVIVDKHHKIVSLGYNGPTEGDLHCVEIGCAKVDGDPVDKKLKRCRGIHGEINAIINTKDVKRLYGATMYTALFPCYDCMKALNNVGITEIVYYKEYKRMQTGGENFEEENESWELAKKRGITIRKYEGKTFLDDEGINKLTLGA